MRKKILIIPIVLLIFIIGYTIADNLDNDSRVALNSDLIYYLSVKYDGVDVLGVESSDATVSEVYSDVINVTDRIPDGLIFNGFSESDDGTIGAVRRDNNSIQCLGKVIDDTNEDGNIGVWNNDNTEYTYHGLHYNANTRTVSFKVKNLKAGCVLNVGIKTKTPTKVDDPNTEVVEKRRDFYNYAVAWESIQTAISNVVHVYIGENNSIMHTVTYQIIGDIPSNYISPPTLSYIKDTTVSVDNNINIEGYTFNGWTSNDVVITDGTFKMPDNNVIITGSFTQNTPYTVTYNIEGDVPSKYVVPLTKNYYENTDVVVDSLNNGDIFNGYKFNGWSSNDVNILDNSFVMPSKNVVITGSFTKLKYKVIYKFQGTVIPDNSASLLPSTQEYNAGDNVVLESINNVAGYEFLGWNKENSFIMPDNDVIVYGEWKKKNGEFEPSITIEEVNGKDYYQVGDKINYKITVTNHENYPIKDVIIKEDLDVVFKDVNYTLVDNIATIEAIDANSSFDIYAEYTVLSSDSNSITNSVSLIGALADNSYELKDKDYSSQVTSNLKSKLKICTTVKGVNVGNSFNIKVYNNNLEYYVKLMHGECDTLFIEPGTYKIFEILPQEYTLESVSGISMNGANFVVSQGVNYQVNFVNRFKNKKFMHIFGEIVNRIGGQ